MQKLLVGKTIKIPCMRSGPCGYDDEVVMLSNETLEKMVKTSHGIPVVIDHQTDETIQSDPFSQIVGRVADMHWDEDRAEWDAHFVVDTQEAVDLLEKGWGVSTAYRIKASGPAGTFNAIPYAREVIDAEYVHLAIVQNPRYEMAKGAVFYNSMSGLKKSLKSSVQEDTIINSQPSAKSAKETGVKTMFKLWRTKREEVKLNNDGNEDLVIEIEGKGEKRLNEMIEEMKNYEDEKVRQKEASAAEEAKKPTVMNDDAVIEYNGEKMTVGALKNKYNEMMAEMEAAKKNAEEKTEEPKKDEPKANEEALPEEKKEEPKANADEEEKKEEPKENSVDSKLLQNAADLANAPFAALGQSPSEPVSLYEKVAEGSKLFGSKK